MYSINGMTAALLFFYYLATALEQFDDLDSYNAHVAAREDGMPGFVLDSSNDGLHKRQAATYQETITVTSTTTGTATSTSNVVTTSSIPVTSILVQTSIVSTQTSNVGTTTQVSTQPGEYRMAC